MKLRLTAKIHNAAEDWKSKYDTVGGLGHYFGEGGEELIWVKLDGKCGLVNTEGKEVVPVKYDVVSDFGEGFAIVERDNKYGYVNTKGEEATPLKYDWVDYFSEGLAIVELKGKYGYVNTEGVEVVPLEYTSIEALEAFKQTK